MKANNYISKKEHILLLIFAFTAFGFVLSVITPQVISIYNYSVSEEQRELKSQADDKPNPRFSGSQSPNIMPLFHFLSFFIFIALLKTKRFLLSSFLTIFYVFCIVYGLSLRFESSMFGGLEISFIKQIRFVAHNYDYLAFSFALILLFWQISILLRMLIKTLQRKTELP
jgi:hypothetical protein